MAEFAESFEITLPSSACQDIFETNTPSNFKIVLPLPPIQLKGEWEVALTKLITPKYLININNENNLFNVKYANLVHDTIEYEHPVDMENAIKIKMDFSHIQTARKNFITRELYFRELDSQLRKLNGVVFLITGGKITRYNGSPANPDSSRLVTFNNDIKIDYITGSRNQSKTYVIQCSNGWSILYASWEIDFQLSISSLQSLTGFNNFNAFYTRHGLGDSLAVLTHGITATDHTYYVPKHTIFLIPPNPEIITTVENTPPPPPPPPPPLDPDTLLVENNTGALVNPNIKKKSGKQQYLSPFIKTGTFQGNKNEETFFDCALGVGHYKTADDLITAMNKLLPAVCKNSLLFSVSEASKLIITSSNPQMYSIKFPQENLLGTMLGIDFEQQGIYLPISENYKQNFEGKYPIDINMSLTAFYVYCDLIDDQIVGNTRASLLRAVHTGNDDSIEFTFSNLPEYKRLARKDITSISISIAGDSGDPVIFATGKTIANLKFRKRPDKIAVLV